MLNMRALILNQNIIYKKYIKHNGKLFNIYMSIQMFSK